MARRFESCRAHQPDSGCPVRDRVHVNEGKRRRRAATAAAIDEANKRAAQLQEANAALSSELTTLKQAPDNPDNLKQNNQALQQQNETLRQQLDQATGELTQLRASRDNEMFRNGALAVLGGVLIALLIPWLRPKKKSEWA